MKRSKATYGRWAASIGKTGKAPAVRQSSAALEERLEALYGAYNRREFVHPDPLELLYAYADPRDQEIAGLLAASLAYGRVTQILASIRKVLDGLGGGSGAGPRAFLERCKPKEIEDVFRIFKHRFTTGREISSLILGILRALDTWGSLEGMFGAALGRVMRLSFLRSAFS